MAAARNEENIIRVVSAQRPGPARTVSLDDLTPGSAAAGTWAGYVWALRQAGHPVGGFDLVPAGHIDAVTQRATADFTARGFDPPIPRVFTPAAGARRDS